jgi:hypothetical protein
MAQMAKTLSDKEAGFGEQKNQPTDDRAQSSHRI